MKASIDIGTNTALLLVAEDENRALQVIHEEQRIPRLGQGVDETRRLSDEAVGRVIGVLKEYQEILTSNFPDVDKIQVTATSAVRDAENRNNFLNTVKEQTGLTVKVLSGLEEAQYTFWGAKSVLDDARDTPIVVIDIGGGSTEIAYGDERFKDCYSYDAGCIRFTERFLEDDPPNQSQVQHCRKAIQEMFEEYHFEFDREASFVGVAGTATSLAYINKQLDGYSSEALAGHRISLDVVAKHIRLFQQFDSSLFLQKYPVVMEGRADIFLAGLLILEGFMQKYGFEELITSTGGIRHGAILHLNAPSG